MLYRISVTERGLTGIANIFRSRLSRLDDLLGAGTVPLTKDGGEKSQIQTTDVNRGHLVGFILQQFVLKA